MSGDEFDMYFANAHCSVGCRIISFKIIYDNECIRRVGNSVHTRQTAASSPLEAGVGETAIVLVIAVSI